MGLDALAKKLKTNSRDPHVCDVCHVSNGFIMKNPSGFTMVLTSKSLAYSQHFPVVFPAFFLDFPMVFHHLMSVSSCFDTAFPGKHAVPISSHGSCFDLQGAKGALPAAFCRRLRWQQRSTLEFEEHLVLRGKKVSSGI